MKVFLLILGVVLIVVGFILGIATEKKVIPYLIAGIGGGLLFLALYYFGVRTVIY